MTTDVYASPSPVRPPTGLAFGDGLALSPGFADTSPRIGATAAEFAATLPDEVARLLAAYEATTVAESQRARVSDFCRVAVTVVAPLNRHTVEQVAAAVLSLTKWAHVVRGLPLFYGLVFGEMVISQWQQAMVSTKVLSAGTVRNYRGHLRRVADALGVTIDTEFVPLTRKARVEPYTATELETHRLWARTLPTPSARDRGLALLAFCAGAGLTSAELVRLRRRDVLTEGGIWVKVTGTNPRLTPVTVDWADEVLRASEGRDRDDALFPRLTDEVGGGLVKTWLRSTPSRYRPSAQRLRASWITSQLSDEANDAKLLVWAGIDRGETLAGYLPFLDDVDPARRRRLLALKNLGIENA